MSVLHVGILSQMVELACSPTSDFGSPGISRFSIGVWVLVSVT